MIDFNDKKQVAKAIQYTNVNPNLTREGLLKHLDVCMKYDFQAAMIAPCYISLAKDVLKGTGIQVASTLNFPQANDTLDMKLAALKEMIKTGVDQFDFPPNPGLLIGGEEKADYPAELRVGDISLPCRVKVSGKVNSLEKMKMMFEAGAELVGTSSGPEIIEGLIGDPNAY